MQQARSPEERWDEHGQQPGSQQSELSENPTVREYDARRCHVCRCKHPPFGFGPPLTRPGLTLWACHDHRAEMHRKLAVNGVASDSAKQRALF